MHLAYKGAAFHGWQSQPNAVSVQSVIEDALSRYCRRPVQIVGAGRTDAGVNARMMIAHLDLDIEPSDCHRLVAALNAMVGRDIAIYGLHPVAPEAHARFDAVSRTYHYYAHIRKSPFTHDLSWFASPELDFDAMNAAAAMMIGRRDFTSFSKLHTDTRTNICDLREARWERIDADNWRFVITADRFLRNMVRAVVGTLVDVGRGKLAPDDVMKIIERKDRCAAGTSMPAHALFLWQVDYPYAF
ncbi:MAG: tRNA pseudouridine(38-40) synthase TruA [Muribaculaceae bacterium]|nr:tRNA pseudouridine(38-40) synthase TruA [Muribaculaceae bacterium]MDE6704238.1 tRNA pseudouridine(38-40) synthase TruA [Muribaculaceae bacterium]